MELIKVDSTKLKIILTPSDMTDRGLTATGFDYADTASKRAFWDILDKAKEETGFDACHGRLYVRFFPSTDGGGELYITKKMRFEKSDGNSKENVTVIGFGSSEELIQLCGRLRADGFESPSDLYLYNGNYFLVLHELTDELYISEYGISLRDVSLCVSILKEHGKLLCESKTVETFCEIFV